MSHAQVVLSSARCLALHSRLGKFDIDLSLAATLLANVTGLRRV